jgi:hypothetical protein
MKWLKRAAIFLTVWVLLALIGYGIALKDYSKKRFDQHQTANGTFNSVSEQSGRISWTDSNFSKDEVNLKIEGSDEVLTLRKSIINNSQTWGVLHQFIRVGTNISVQTTENDNQKTIVQLIVNAGTVFQRNLFSAVQASQGLKNAVTENIKIGRWYIGLGISGLFMLIGVWVRTIKNRNGTTTRPRLYTN